MNPIATPPAAWAASFILHPRSSRLGPLLTSRTLGRVLSASLGRSALTRGPRSQKVFAPARRSHDQSMVVMLCFSFCGLAPSGHPYGDSKLAATGQADFLRCATEDSQYGPSLFRSLSIASGHGRKRRAGKKTAVTPLAIPYRHSTDFSIAFQPTVYRAHHTAALCARAARCSA